MSHSVDLIGIVARDPFTKYEVDRVGNSKDMRVCSCCHDNQSKGGLVLSQGTCVLNTKLIRFQATNVWMYILVVIITRVP